MTRLTNLRPTWIRRRHANGLLLQAGAIGLEFDCPVCGGAAHRLVAHFTNPPDGPPAPWAKRLWTRDGDTFADLTLEPSLRYPCFQGWVDRGLVVSVSESPLTVFGVVNSQPAPVPLSPTQALLVARAVLAAVEGARAGQSAS